MVTVTTCVCVGGGSQGYWRVCILEGNTKSKYLTRWDYALLTKSPREAVSADLGRGQNRAPHRAFLGGVIMRQRCRDENQWRALSQG